MHKSVSSKTSTPAAVAIALLLLTHSASVVFAQTAPMPPDGLSAEIQCPGIVAVRLTWRESPDAMRYRVYRDSAPSPGQLVGETASLAYLDSFPAFTDTSRYVVTAIVDISGVILESAPSNVAMVLWSGNPLGHTGSVSGVVRDQSGSPLENIPIRFYRISSLQSYVPTVRTNHAGQYNAVLDSGKYLIRAETAGLLPRLFESTWYPHANNPAGATTIDADSGSNAIASFVLHARQAPAIVTVEGTVVDSAGMPLDGTVVTFTRTIQAMNSIAAATGQGTGLGGINADVLGLGFTQGIVGTATTNAVGRYEAHIDGGEVIAVASKNGYRPQMFNNTPDPTCAQVLVLDTDTSGIDFRLPAILDSTSSIDGTVRDSLLNGVPSRVILFPRPRQSSSQPTLFTHTDSLGRFRFIAVPEGEHVLYALPFGIHEGSYYRSGVSGVTRWQEAEILEPPAGGANLRVQTLPMVSAGVATVTGLLTTPDGSSLAGAHVVARSVVGGSLGQSTADNQGSFVVEFLPAGAMLLTIDRIGYDGQRGTIQIPGSSYALDNLTIRLMPMLETAIAGTEALTGSYFLEQNFPNPFNPQTRIRFAVPRTGVVTLKVFDLLGREVALLVDEELAQGSYHVDFNAAGLAGGVYFYRIESLEFRETKKLLIMK